MSAYSMVLRKHSLHPGESWRPAAGQHAIWLREGTVDIGGQPVGTGEGFFTAGTDSITPSGATMAELLHFEITATPAQEGEGALLGAGLDLPDTNVILRLDQVTFPPGARAYRHVHPGPGIRCLTEGALEIQSDHHVETMTPMMAWFEDADSPVQATAGPLQTAFVRAMVLPAAFEGKPTLRYLNAEDELKPRLQTNRRFFDRRLGLRSG